MIRNVGAGNPVARIVTDPRPSSKESWNSFCSTGADTGLAVYASAGLLVQCATIAGFTGCGEKVLAMNGIAPSFQPVARASTGSKA